MQKPAVMNIPEKYTAGYLSGELDISKAVVRDTATGRILEHIDLIDSSNLTNSSLQNDALFIGLGAAATVAVAVGVITIVVCNKRKKSKIQLPEYTIRFHNMFSKYLKEAREGKLEPDTINDLLEVLDEVESKQDSDFRIDFSAEELRTLLQIIFNYTKDLANATGTSAEYLAGPIDDSYSNIVNFRDCLLLQKEMIEKSA